MRISWSATRRPTAPRSIGLAHEALLREWPPAVRWIEQNRGLLRLRAGITAAAMLWRNSNSQEGRLLTGALLKDAARLLKEMPEMLAPEERASSSCRSPTTAASGGGCSSKAPRRLRLVALAILVPTIGVGQISYGVSFVRTLPSVWNDSQRIPVSAGGGRQSASQHRFAWRLSARRAAATWPAGPN